MAYRRTEAVERRLAGRREALLAAARAFAAERGMQAVQVLPIAKRAGVAAGTMYRYFPSKPALVEAVARAFAAAEVSAIDRAAARAPGPLSALAAALVACAARAARQRRLLWALTGEPVDAETEAARAGVRAALADALRVRIEAIGEALGDTDPALAARAVLAVILEGASCPRAPALDEAGEQARVRALALLCLRAVGVPDGRARGLVVQAPWPDGA